MGDDDPDRVRGVDFAAIEPVLDDISCPITADELVERYGDRGLERTSTDPISSRELFDHVGDDTFESEDQLRQTILGQTPRDSEGRTNDSDRGGSNPTLTDDAEDAEDATSADHQVGGATDPDTTQQ